jgi:hypothetical protein
MILKPEILTHPNIPKPLHGISPRTINGDAWWNSTRREVYASDDYHCIACGVYKYDALIHQWLEAHEYYEIDYKKGTMVCKSIEPLCHCCHSFIHSGRLENIAGKEKSISDVVDILERGFTILSQFNLKCFPGTFDFALRLKANTFGVRPYKIDSKVPWNKWRFIWNGKEYFSKFKNEEELNHFYESEGKMERPVPKLRDVNLALKAKSISVPKPGKIYTLPTKVTEPVDDLGAYSFLIYGSKKIGKTTLASLFPDTLFFMFEAGAKALRIKRVDINVWEDALGYLSALEAAPVKPKTIVIDTGFESNQKALKYVCQQENIEYPRTDNFGKDWDTIKRQVRDFHDRIIAMGTGLVVLCHETVKEKQTFIGQKYDQVVPLLNKALDDFYRAVIDNVWWYHYRGKQRFLQIRGTDHAMAGTALQADRFFKTKNGVPISAIPIPNDPRKGMEAILKAFHNEQERPYTEETEQFSERTVKESINDKIRKESRKRR